MRKNILLKATSLAAAVVLIPFGFNACSPFTARRSEATFSSLAVGEKLYESNCKSCHGEIDKSTKLNRGTDFIANAIVNEPQMKSLASLTRDDLDSIAAALGSRTIGKKYVCTDTRQRGKSENGFRRLSYGEIKNTLADIFGQDVIDSMSSLSSMSLDQVQKSVTEFNPSMTKAQVTSTLNLNLEISERVSQDPNLLNRFAPPCAAQQLASGLQDACLADFIDKVGKRIHRRPVTLEQKADYTALYKSGEIASLLGAEKLQVLIAKMLQAPEAQFLYLVSAGAPVDGRAKLDAYSVANRLSYSLTSSGPDTELMAKADSGEVMDPNKLQVQANRLLESARGRSRIHGIFSVWLNLANTKLPTENAIRRAGMNSSIGIQNSYRAYAMHEIYEYAEYLVFNNGTFYDLMTSNYAFPRTSELAYVLGLPSVYNGGAPLVTSGPRRGLFGRPAFLINNSDRESVIKRGVVLRTRFLCDPVPPPPADLDAAIGDAGNSFDQNQFSSREVAAKLTANGSCITCHSQLNPLGFVMSAYGPLGEYRTTEKTYNGDGSVFREFPINTSVANVNVDSANDNVSSSDDFAELMGRSAKGKACLATYAFRMLHMREEEDSDKCALADVESMLQSGMPLKQVFLKNATSDDIYWRGF
ncbi:MAG: DUF1588 domain-containing protein [Proteobacteria bacterium]|nr:MAG: DUF1588 domain-containing protein [Pseudomonadota bacterium]